MAKTFRPTGCLGSPQSLPTSPSHSNCLLAADRAIDYPNTATLGQTESGLDWPSRDPARTAQTGVGQTSARAGDDQAGVANARLGCHIGRDTSGLFSQAADHAGGNIARVGLDVSLSRRGSQGLCFSHSKPAHPRLLSDDCPRQEQPNGNPPLPGDLENPGNPAVFATRQRCRLLWRVQGAACLWAVRPVVLVFGHRTYLLARRRTRMQWRGRRVERPVEPCFLGAPTVYLVRACVSSQSYFHAVVYDGLCAPFVGRLDPPTGATHRTPASVDAHANCPPAGSVAHHCWATAFHSETVSVGFCCALAA